MIDTSAGELAGSEKIFSQSKVKLLRTNCLHHCRNRDEKFHLQRPLREAPV
jgi:hypothetical protein